MNKHDVYVVSGVPSEELREWVNFKVHEITRSEAEEKLTAAGVTGVSGTLIIEMTSVDWEAFGRVAKELEAEQVMAAKRQAEKDFYGRRITRSGITKPGMKTRDKKKVKQVKESRKRNRR